MEAARTLAIAQLGFPYLLPFFLTYLGSDFFKTYHQIAFSSLPDFFWSEALWLVGLETFFRPTSIMVQADLISFGKSLSLLMFMRHAVHFFFRLISYLLPPKFLSNGYLITVRSPAQVSWFSCVSSIGLTLC